jgi:hypothetical protein
MSDESVPPVPNEEFDQRVLRRAATFLEESLRDTPELRSAIVILDYKKDLGQNPKVVSVVLRGQQEGALSYDEVFGLLDRLQASQKELIRMGEQLTRDLASHYVERARRLMEMDREIATRQSQ